MNQRQGLSRRELMKALAALPLVGGMIADAEAAKKSVAVTPPSTARKIAEREIRTNRFGEPEGGPAVWIDGRYHGSLKWFEVKHEFLQLDDVRSLRPRDAMGNQYITLWWQGGRVSGRAFHDFTGLLVRLQTDNQRLTFRGYPCNESYDDEGNVCLLLRVADILEFSSP